MSRYFLLKTAFDFLFALFALLLLWPVLLICLLTATFETRSLGLFVQRRIGRFGKPFHIFKIKTMVDTRLVVSGVTIASDCRITRSGLFMRRFKLDELPQLLNVLIGQMSFVGPRPDLPGYADRLKGPDRRILMLRPGITGPASLYYRNEEEILDSVEDPIAYNRDVIWPHKVSINLLYVNSLSFTTDLKIIFKTLFL